MKPELKAMLVALAAATPDDPETVKAAIKQGEKLVVDPAFPKIVEADASSVVQVMDSAISLVNKLTDDLQDALIEIERLRAYCDKDLDRMMLSIQAELNTYASCKEAALTYTDRWFAELPFSDDGLKQIATMLISTTEPFLGENINPVWNEISRGNIATFNRLNELVKGQDDPGSDAE